MGRAMRITRTKALARSARWLCLARMMPQRAWMMASAVTKSSFRANQGAVTSRRGIKAVPLAIARMAKGEAIHRYRLRTMLCRRKYLGSDRRGLWPAIRMGR